MELEKINKDNFGDVIQRIRDEAEDIPVEEYLKQYDPKGHDVNDPAIREDREVVVETEEEIGPDGQPKTTERKERVLVNRIAHPFQKDIVDKAVAFLCGNPVELDANPKNDVEERMLAALREVWLDNKLDYRNMDIATVIKSETQAAEIWYKVPKDGGYKLRLKIIAASTGDKLYPVFDTLGDMVAFGREYKIKDGKQTIDRFDLYTEKVTYKGTREQTGWTYKEEYIKPQKIPVIYGRQEIPDWLDVQPLINRYEESTSNHADTNDKHTDPSVVLKGEILQQDKKGKYGGQVFNVNADGDAHYMAWDHVVTSTELEQKTLKSGILYFSSTPETTMEQMSALGNYSGIALKMLFLSAHMKAAKAAAGYFGEYIQRRINYLKAALATLDITLAPAVNMQITPKFEYFLPKDDVEKINLLTTAKQGGILSQETAVMQNPIVEDPVAELEKIKTEGLNQQNDDEL